MRLLFAILLVFIAAITRAAVPTFQSFEPTQFLTNNNRIAYIATHTNDAGIIYPALVNSLTLTTNENVYGTFSLPAKVTLLTLGTNYLDVSTNSTWLLNSPTNDATQVIISLSAGAYQGQLLFITSQNGSNSFTLPDLSEQWDVPGAFVDIQGDWVGTTNRGAIFQYAAPDWLEMARFDPSQTGGGTILGSGTVPYLPYWTASTTLSDSLLQQPSEHAIYLITTNLAVNPNFIIQGNGTNVLSAIYSGYLSDSDGTVELSQINLTKAGANWGAGTPALRDGSFNVSVLHDAAMNQRLGIDGDTGLISFFDRDGSAVVFSVANASGYTGTGANFLADDGIYKAGTGGLTINPTDGFIPYRLSSTTFSNSPIQRIDATSIGLNSVSNVLSTSGSHLLYTNSSTGSVFIQVKNAAATNSTASFGVSSGAATILQADTGRSIVFNPNNSSESVELSSSYLAPISGTLDVGTGGAQWRDIYLSQHIVWNGTTNSVFDTIGYGSPEGVLTALSGSLYRDVLNGTFYGKTNGAGNTGWGVLLAGSGSGAALWASAGGVLVPSPAVDIVWIESQLADNATNVALVVDTAVTWTDGFLAALKNHGTNQALIDYVGSYYGGVHAWDFDGGSIPSLVLLGESAIDGSGQTRLILESIDDYNSTTNDVYIQFTTSPTDAVLTFAGASTLLNFHPTVASTGSSSAYTFNTSTNLLAGDLIAKFQNNGTNKFTISNLGQITLAGTTNQVTFGATNSAPSSSAAPTKWISVTVSGDAGVYRLPLYE